MNGTNNPGERSIKGMRLRERLSGRGGAGRGVGCGNLIEGRAFKAGKSCVEAP